MSIVITVVTPYAAVQVSDMQVTAFKDGTVVSGQQQKSIMMQGSQVVFVIGWTGLATIANHNTGEWLHGQLDGMNAPSLPLETIVKTLAESATLHFATLPKTDKRSTFSLGGWFVTPIDTVEPFSCRITNCEVDPLGTPYSLSSREGVTPVRRKSKKFPAILQFLLLNWTGENGLRSW